MKLSQICLIFGMIFYIFGSLLISKSCEDKFFTFGITLCFVSIFLFSCFISLLLNENKGEK